MKEMIMAMAAVVLTLVVYGSILYKEISVVLEPLMRALGH